MRGSYEGSSMTFQLHSVGPPAAATTVPPFGPGLQEMPELWHPVHRGIVAVTVHHETRLSRATRDELRREAYRLLDAALVESGILPRHRDEITCYREGLVAPIRPVDEVPKTLLIGAVAPTLGRLVAERNAVHPTGPVLRLRVVVHSGEVHRTAKGVFGESLEFAFRLLNAPRVKGFCRALTDPVVLVVSEDIYWSIVRHGYEGIDRMAYVPLVRIHAGRRRQGYVHLGIGCTPPDARTRYKRDRRLDHLPAVH